MLAGSFFLACNNATESAMPDIPATDSIAWDTAETASVTTDSASVPSLDTVPSVARVRPGGTGGGGGTAVETDSTPKASIAYSYKDKMKKGEKGLIQMHVQLNKPLTEVASHLKTSLGEEKAIQTGSSDTSLVKSLEIAGAKYFHVTIDYDTAIFLIEKSVGEEKQELRYSKPNKWVWRVTAKKETSKSDIIIIVKTEGEDGKIHESDNGILPVEITVDPTDFANANNEVSQPSFLNGYGWWLLAAGLLIVGWFTFAAWRRKKRERELRSRVFLSYAWSTGKDTIIDKLYNSLKNAGYNVVRDKVDLGYKGLISGFMKDIGKGNIIIVSLSDKYLKSRFCMFELYEIYRNCGMDKAAFVKKVFPIREEDINLSDVTVVNKYVQYWEAEEVKWETLVKDKEQEITSEQFAQYEIIRRISNEMANLLYFLSDINALNVELVADNDFAAVKKSLQAAIDGMEEG